MIKFSGGYGGKGVGSFWLLRIEGDGFGEVIYL